jgi:branched-subunit amino acid transport protein
MNVWVALLLAGLGTFLLRMLPVALLGRIPSPGWLDRAGFLVAPVAFAAMAASAVAGGAATGAETTARLAAVAVAAAVAYRTRSTAATLATGMATLWIVSTVYG